MFENLRNQMTFLDLSSLTQEKNGSERLFESLLDYSSTRLWFEAPVSESEMGT